MGDILNDLWDCLDEYHFNFNCKPSQHFMFCGMYKDASYTISPTCEVYKCWDYVGEERHRIAKIDSLGNLIDVQYAYIDWMSHNPILVSDCKECSYLPACGGGCGSVSYSKYNTYHEKGCFKIKGVLDRQIERMFQDKSGLHENC